MNRIHPEKYKREAQQAETLSVLEKHSRDILDSKIALISVDTVLYEHYENIGEAEIWLNGLHWEWLGVNQDLCRQSNASVYYRYIVLPYPYAIKNPAKRRRLIDFIVLNLHVHLWHGVICILKFLDPRKHDLRSLTNEMNFFTIPKAKEFLGLPSWYRSKSIEQVLFRGKDYERQRQLVRRWLLINYSKLTWLFYDECHFQCRRLDGWHWKQLRRFFYQLNENYRICPLCNSQEATELDHVGPRVRGHFQTLPNLQLLCGLCNRSKSTIELLANPFELRAPISPNSQSAALTATLNEPPSWLGKISRPARNEATLASILDLN